MFTSTHFLKTTKNVGKIIFFNLLIASKNWKENEELFERKQKLFSPSTEAPSVLRAFANPTNLDRRDRPRPGPFLTEDPPHNAGILQGFILKLKGNPKRPAIPLWTPSNACECGEGHKRKTKKETHPWDVRNTGWFFWQSIAWACLLAGPGFIQQAVSSVLSGPIPMTFLGAFKRQKQILLREISILPSLQRMPTNFISLTMNPPQ